MAHLCALRVREGLELQSGIIECSSTRVRRGCSHRKGGAAEGLLHVWILGSLSGNKYLRVRDTESVSRTLLAGSQKKRFEWMNFIDFRPFHNELQGLWCLGEMREAERRLAKPKMKIKPAMQGSVVYMYVYLVSL